MPRIAKPLYASASAAIAFTSLSGLASSATAGTGAESALIDNSSTLYSRIRIHGNFCMGNGTPANDKAIYVFLYPVVPNPSGTDTAVGCNRIPQMIDQTLPRAAPSPTAPFPETMPGVRLIATVPAPAAGCLLKWTCHVKDVPRKFGLFVRNNSGVPLSSSLGTWTASTGYLLGVLVTPVTSNGHYYLCITAGTSSAAEPTWPIAAKGETVSDGTATWLDIGTNAPNTMFYQGENDQIV